ncbi:MAG: M42 family peptidase, partial [Candidatus Hodarchaeota archaeon]
MKNRQIKLLENLIKISSPSGFEEKIAEFIKKELLQYLPASNVKVDFRNNVTAIIKGSSDKKIMIDAHSDQIGFIVTNVDREGLIS